MTRTVEELQARFLETITETEEKLQRANDRVEMLLDSITDRFFALDHEWRLTYFNRHAEDQLKILDKDPARMIGKVMWDEFDVPAEVADAFRRAWSERTLVTHEHFYPPLGEWVENRIYPTLDGGLAVFQRYVTEQKRAEAELRRSEALLAEGERMSHTGSWVWNAGTGQLFWSPEHFRICGLDPATFTLTVESAQQSIHPDDRVGAIHAFEQAVRERSLFEMELRVARPDGTVRHVRSVARPVFTDTGDLAEFVGTMLDITDRKAEEHTQQELRRRLVVAQEDERRRIALEMHDQFGQELSLLALKLSGLKRDCGRRTRLGEELAVLEAIARQLDTDLELIVSRLRPSALDDLGLMPALTNYVRRWAEHFDVRAELHATDLDSGRLTNEIEIALYRIALEALNNIAKHAQATNVAVLLDGRFDRVSLIIEDDGVGFDLEQPAGTRQTFGVLGMRERATLLGGTLDIESRPGKGTTVAVRIPLPRHA